MPPPPPPPTFFFKKKKKGEKYYLTPFPKLKTFFLNAPPPHPQFYY